jgi:hypothetical protein
MAGENYEWDVAKFTSKPLKQEPLTLLKNQVNFYHKTVDEINEILSLINKKNIHKLNPYKLEKILQIIKSS